MKTKDVHFYVQRKSSYYAEGNRAIPFEIELLNLGGAMNSTSGVFTTPVPGTYFFAFSAVKEVCLDYLVVSIQVNGIDHGRGYTEHYGPSIKTKSTVSLTSSLYLKAGDQVNMRVEYGCLLDEENYHHAHFTGWLVTEELVLA